VALNDGWKARSQHLCGRGGLLVGGDLDIMNLAAEEEEVSTGCFLAGLGTNWTGDQGPRDLLALVCWVMEHKHEASN
jgi:hypothetical protein